MLSSLTVGTISIFNIEEEILVSIYEQGKS